MGSASITRGFSDSRKGWVTLLLETPKHSKHEGLQIYITRTGKVRIHGPNGEWLPTVNKKIDGQGEKGVHIRPCTRKHS